MAVSPEAIEKALILGDLAKLDADQKIEYYNNVCKSLGLNPLTKPFDFISLNGKLQLYAKKDATDQLRRIYQVSVTDLKHTHNEPLGLYVVTAVGQNGQGRLDAATGAVSVKGMAGEALANAIMKAESKAKRRLTLSLVGLGMLDETEIETVQPEQMLTIKDGQIEVPADVKMPEPKPKKEPKTKKEIPSVEVAPLEPVQKTDGEGFEAAKAAFEARPTRPNRDLPTMPGSQNQMFPQELIDRAVVTGTQVGYQHFPPSVFVATAPLAEPNKAVELSEITDADLPSNLNPDTLPTPDELKIIGKQVKEIVPQDKMSLLGKHLKKQFGKSSTKELTSKEWATTIEALQEAQKSGKLDDLLKEAV